MTIWTFAREYWQNTECCPQFEVVSWLPTISFFSNWKGLTEANIWSRFKSKFGGRCLGNLLKWKFLTFTFWQITQNCLSPKLGLPMICDDEEPDLKSKDKNCHNFQPPLIFVLSSIVCHQIQRGLECSPLIGKTNFLSEDKDTNLVKWKYLNGWAKLIQIFK